MDMANIREAIKQLLKDKGISLSAFAAECGMEQASLCRFVNGKTGLSGDNLLKVLGRLPKKALG
jgi:transcriptional regulator with XRE-family HTH domain